MLLKDYLNGLKQAQKLSWKDISELSGMSEDTVRSIFYGNTADPRLSTITRLVYALGGKLDDIEKDNNIKINKDIISLAESYEQRLKDKDEQINALKKDKRTFMIVSGVLVLFIIGMLVADIFIGSHGWIVYK